MNIFNWEKNNQNFYFSKNNNYLKKTWIIFLPFWSKIEHKLFLTAQVNAFDLFPEIKKKWNYTKEIKIARLSHSYLLLSLKQIENKGEVGVFLYDNIKY